MLAWLLVVGCWGGWGARALEPYLGPLGRSRRKEPQGIEPWALYTDPLLFAVNVFVAFYSLCVRLFDDVIVSLRDHPVELKSLQVLLQSSSLLMK